MANPGNLILAELQKLNNEMAKQTILLAQLCKKGLQKNEDNEYLTTQQAAQFVKRSTETIRRWIRDDKLNGIKLNRGSDKDRYLIPKQSLEKLVNTENIKNGGHVCPK